MQRWREEREGGKEITKKDEGTESLVLSDAYVPD